MKCFIVQLKHTGKLFQSPRLKFFHDTKFYKDIARISGVSKSTVSRVTSNDNGVIHLVNDDERGGQLAAEFMLTLGLSNMAFIAGPQEHRSHFLRLKGFREKLHGHGYEMDESHICCWTLEAIRGIRRYVSCAMGLGNVQRKSVG
ncbi:LacI family DNA-binding transcriptional regulator [Paenibacillus beijingensis]|uniref:HTH lacI-type domain-containing protein n=1 Tax=Paenibacillus beijingensis TaxID=1126833 RepID=A0A0D5NNF1_9BACL|nr:hypothetical protein VN24_21440 [Paenibacillus beijingensis]